MSIVYKSELKLNI